MLVRPAPPVTTIMKTNHVRQKLKAGQATVGCFLGMGSPNVAEQMAHSGFDFIVIEMEHNGLDMAEVQHMLMAINGTDAIPIVRIPSSDQVFIQRSLDIGALGIIVPLLRSAEQAREVVRATRYPPDGIRGFGPLRASHYTLDYPDYLGRANDNILVSFLLETREAMENLEEITAVPGGRRAVPGPVGPVPESRREPLRDAASGNGQGGGARDSRVRGERGRPGDRLRHPGRPDALARPGTHVPGIRAGFRPARQRGARRDRGVSREAEHLMPDAGSSMLDATAAAGDPTRLKTLLAEHGYLLLRGALNRDLVQRVRDDLIAVLHDCNILESPAAPPIWSGGPAPTEEEYMAYYERAVQLDSFNRLAESAEVRAVMEAIYDGPVQVWEQRLLRIIPPDPDGAAPLGVGAHQDGSPQLGYLTQDFSTAWIPLTDIDERLGGLAVVPGLPSGRCARADRIGVELPADRENADLRGAVSG
ncbi:2-dehydro-3,6-dideoxy-6-sulfogluconate aldolase [Geodia barretti]|uniref:2-dehydro-3,6-dideoxy-6-sulfogluconate aldolase n=1 Tax=Geodia barretti TaxID=519541 RepID=A0AA35XI52_GEOBA|nr:2-dehydro-3,6-dideoxy-6-sulfogluconate aldolase [Geodia barretti]